MIEAIILSGNDLQIILDLRCRLKRLSPFSIKDLRNTVYINRISLYLSNEDLLR